MKDARISLLANEHCQTGENPYWDPVTDCVYWTDIPNGKLFRYDRATGTHRTIYEGPPVGGFTRQADGTLLLFRVDDIAVLDLADGSVRSLIPFADEGSVRFNDVIADPEGRVFAGTIGRDTESGGLFRLDRDGTFTLLFRGTRTANGMGFSPDLRTFYWTCSTYRRIYRFNYDRHTGELSQRELLYQASEAEGKPDGLTVDMAGNIWAARWEGYSVVIHNPEGHIIGDIRFPVPKVSSCFFGGPDLDLLFVTTAGGAPDRHTTDGALYQVEVPACGKPEFVSRVSP
jgi:D-xylono/L-arabinono-1,4-lactonase